MPVRTRITGQAERADLTRKSKGRHPILKLGSRHNAVFQTILQDGNPKGGITAAQIEAICGQYHPQILKDLLDYRLVTQYAKNSDNSYRYIADPKMRGTYIQEVTVEVTLLEDEHGRFFTLTKLPGRHPKPGRIVRALGTRKLHFRVPLPEQEGVQAVKNDSPVDPDFAPVDFDTASEVTIDGEAVEVI
jgi:hypothetical protein